MEIKEYQMKYKLNKTKSNNYSLKILDKEFIKNNRNKVKLIFENKKYELTEYIQLNNFKKTELKINILFSQDISNISFMFKNCQSLLEFSIIDNIENNEINNEYDIPELEQKNNELEDDQIEGYEDKGNIYEGLENDMNIESSEIQKKEKSIKEKKTFLEINNLLNINYKETIYICKSISSKPDK